MAGCGCSCMCVRLRMRAAGWGTEGIAVGVESRPKQLLCACAVTVLWCFEKSRCSVPPSFGEYGIWQAPCSCTCTSC